MMNWYYFYREQEATAIYFNIKIKPKCLSYLYKKYARAAGPMRNKETAQCCDYAICFWNGESKGTKSMIEYAKEMGKEVKIKMIK